MRSTSSHPSLVELSHQNSRRSEFVLALGNWQASAGHYLGACLLSREQIRFVSLFKEKIQSRRRRQGHTEIQLLMINNNFKVVINIRNLVIENIYREKRTSKYVFFFVFFLFFFLLENFMNASKHRLSIPYCYFTPTAGADENTDFIVA